MIMLAVIGLLLIMGSLYGIYGIPKYWRHEVTLFDRVPSWWVWGETAWFAWLKAMPIAAIATFCLGLFGVLDTIVNGQELPKAILLPLAVIFIMYIFLSITCFY